MLSLHGITRRFGTAIAVDRTDLAVDRGETLALIGPSGCGKSTLLRIVNGLVMPDSGEVWIEGTRLAAANVRALRLRMGYVIQEGGLFPHLSARDNVALMPRLQGWAEGRIDRRLTELADLVRLPAGHLARFPGRLSGGERQRVALMRALVMDPDLLLLDEPLGALDPMIRFELQEELKTAFDRLGKTVLLVTHDMAEAMHFAHRIALMRDGQIVQQGSAAELLEQPAESFVRDFLRAQRLGPAD